MMSKKTIAAVSAPASSSSSSSTPSTSNTNNSLLDVPALIAPMQVLHDSCANHSYEWRVTQLKQLRALLVEHWDALAAALRADLGKCTVEAVCMELIMVRSDLDYTIRNLKTWMKPQNVASPMVCLPAFTRLEQRPLLGPAVLIIGPSNYPVSLVLHPTIGALAAGNPVVLKPSELTPAVEGLLAKLIPQYFDNDCVVCVTGGIPETTALLQQAWGRIFFTGSAAVGKLVAKAGAASLTPVTLELGGKAPVFIDAATCPPDIQQVANRIIWAKTVNSGQTCAAADTLIVEKKLLSKLLPALKRSLHVQYGEDPSKSEFGRIVSPKHAKRLVNLLQQIEQTMDDKVTKIIAGGSQLCDAEACYIAPTIILNPPADSQLLQEEIFGPILPIVTVQSRAEAVAYMKHSLPGTPLCTYIFTSSEAVFQEINRQIPAGSVMRNDCLMHLSSPWLPFGGLGSSGFGSYHGKYTFQEFSHTQPIMYRPSFPGADFHMIRYHPYPFWKRWLLLNVFVGLPGIPNLHFSVLWKTTVVRIVAILIWKFAVPAETQAAVWSVVADRVQDLAAWIRPAAVVG